MRIRPNPAFAPRPETDVLSSLTLDQLVRNIVRRDPDGIFLADPPNLDAVCQRSPETLSWRDAELRIEAFARSLVAVGLREGDIVALRMPNCADALIALCGIWRAGLVACPLPLGWRGREWVNALSLTAPKALITTARIDVEDAAETARQMASRQFSIRFVGSFGDAVPDGVVALDPLLGDFSPDADHVIPDAQLRPERGESVAIVHIVETDNGMQVLPRSHVSVMAGALRIVTEMPVTSNDRILTTMIQGHLAGLTTGLATSLLSGAALHLHHPLCATTLTAQIGSVRPTMMVAPTLCLDAIRDAADHDAVRYFLGINAFGLHVVPSSQRVDPRVRSFAALGDFALLPGIVGDEGRIEIALGDGIINPLDADSPVFVSIERMTGTDADTTSGVSSIAVSGAAAPDGPWSGTDRARRAGDAQDNDPATALPIRVSFREPDRFVVDGLTSGLGAVGGLAFDMRALDRTFSRIKGTEAAAVAADVDSLAIGIVPEGARAVDADDVWAALSDLAIADHKRPDRLATFVSLPRRADGGVDRDTILKKAAQQ